MKKMFSLMLILASCVCITSCNNDEDEPVPTISKSSVTMNVGESVKLTYSGKDCTWSSENPVIASVSSQGVVTANLVGETKVRANNLYCKVTVAPKYTMYVEPYTGWGATQSVVKSKMSGYSLYDSSSTDMTYEGKGNVFAYMYSFENGKLSGSSMAIFNNNATYLSDFILERYIPIDYDDSAVYFMSSDEKTIGAVMVASGYVLVVYIPHETNSRDNNFKEQIDAKMEEFKLKIKRI